MMSFPYVIIKLPSPGDVFQLSYKKLKILVGCRIIGYVVDVLTTESRTKFRCKIIENRRYMLVNDLLTIEI